MKKQQEINMTICRDTKALRHKRRRKRRRQRFLTMLFVMMIFLTGFGFKFYQSHFNPGTLINGLDCSWLTPEEAYGKLNSIFQPEIWVKLDTADCYFSSDAIDLSFDNSIEEMLLTQKSSTHQQDFSFSSFSFDETKLKEILQLNLEPEKRFYPENAYIILEDDFLTVVPEVEGNFIPFEEAYQLVSEQLKTGNWVVDLTPLTISEPEVTAADLEANVEEINSILKTSITFTIKKDCTLILDKSVMCKWLVVLENGKYFLDLDTNLPRFVESLQEKCDANMPVSISFQGTGDVGRYSIPAYKLPLDTEAELAFIRERIYTGESYTHQPIYHDNQDYVEVDITRQHVWFYKNGVCVVESDCVTGTANGERDTSRGYFFLENKRRNKTLTGPGYSTPVAYWMPFNGGQGLHDANWRRSFGGSIYLTNGSHGCVNLPPDVAKTIFENIDISTPVIVYASS